MTDTPIACDGITNERERRAHGGKLSCCPLCGSTQDVGYALCFHCSECGYFQCCDCDGYYDKGAKSHD